MTTRNYTAAGSQGHGQDQMLRECMEKYHEPGAQWVAGKSNKAEEVGVEMCGKGRALAQSCLGFLGRVQTSS